MFNYLRKTNRAEFHNWCSTYRELYKFSPDASYLERYDTVHCFIYNEFMTGRREHSDFMELSPTRVGAAFTHSNKFVMWKKDVGFLSFPIVLAQEAPVPWLRSSRKLENLRPAELDTGSMSRIKGELYEMSPEMLFELDRVLLNGVQFKRIRGNVLVPYRRCNTRGPYGTMLTQETVVRKTAWIYVGIPSYWNAVLDARLSCSLVNRFSQHPNRREYSEVELGDYYYYSALEEDE